jgi:hypothetical protein
MERLLNTLVDKLKRAHGARLVSVTLYGSAAGDDRDPKYSDYNILCVLSQITPRELADAEPVFRWWREKGNPSPLLLSEVEVRTATDCFAIEFHDIKRQYRVLEGADVIANLAIDDSFYRAQVEYELRAKTLRLRQKASGILSDSPLLRKLLADSVSTFCVLMRHSLRLHGVDASMKKREVVEQGGKFFGTDFASFRRLLDLRDEHIKPSELDAASVFAAYLKEIEVIVDAVDRLEKRS